VDGQKDLGLLRKAGTELFCYSQLRKESFLIVVMCYGKKEKHGERNNARYYFWSKKKRKTTLEG